MTTTTLTPWHEYLRLADIARAAWAAYEHDGGVERLQDYRAAFQDASEALRACWHTPATTQGETR